MFTVKKGVVLPPPRVTSDQLRKYPFHLIEVGELFFVPGVTTNDFSTYAAKVGRTLGRRFRTQTIVMRQDLQTDEWEPCKPGAAGAKKGVVVCRTA